MPKEIKKPPTSQKPTMGYPMIENLLETEDFKKINQSMSACYETLESMLKNKSGGLKKQKLIRQALKAYDLTSDLIRQLLKTKHEMIENQKNVQTPNIKGEKK